MWKRCRGLASPSSMVGKDSCRAAGRRVSFPGKGGRDGEYI